MKQSTLFVILLIAACFLISAPQAKANSIYAHTSVTFDEQSGIIHGRAVAEASYGIYAYYDISLTATLESDDGTYVDYGYGYSSGNTSYAEVDLQVEAADTEYTITAEYDATVLYQDSEPPPDYALYSWIDYYSFTSLYGGLQIYAVDWYEFFGQLTSYPNYYVANPNINMGRTHSRKKVGRPDHLWVLSDDIVSGHCGRTERYITYQVVDYANHTTGRTSVIEQFPGTVTDSCSGLVVQSSSSCTVRNDGTIPDGIHVGVPGGMCPNSIDGSCGYILDVDRWQWCPRNSSPITLATLTYDVHWNYIGINGRYTRWPIGGQFRP